LRRLVVKSFAAILRVDPGMQVDNTLSLAFSRPRCATIAAKNAPTITARSSSA